MEMLGKDAGSVPSVEVAIRAATDADLPAIAAIDEATTGEAKPGHWHELFAHFAQPRDGQAFLVAVYGDRVVGFITGEIRVFEFGSEPCGWVFAMSVDPSYRLHSVGTKLFEALCAIFRRAGVEKVRTMLQRNDRLVLAFFRSLGMMTGPFIQLEKDLD